MKQWMISMALFMAVFVCCIATIFSPVKVARGTTDYITGEEIIVKQTDFAAMGGVWRENPNYFITVGITAVLALSGASLAVCMMNGEKKKNEADS